MTMSKKNPDKNPVHSRKGGAAIIPGNPGNSGGKPGRSGRTPNAFKRRLRQLVCSEETEAYLAQCLRGEHGPKVFLTAYRYCVDQAYGRPVQAVQVEGDVRQFVMEVPSKETAAEWERRWTPDRN